MLICKRRRRPPSASAGLRFVLVVLKDTEIQVLILLGKMVLKYFGVFYVGFCLSASWITDKRRVCRGNGLYVSAYRKRLLGFGCPCNVEGWAVTLFTAVSPCAGLALMPFVEPTANLVTSTSIGVQSALMCPCASKTPSKWPRALFKV